MIGLRKLHLIVGFTLVPFLRGLFRFSMLHPIDILICVIGGFVSIGWFEAYKYVHNHIMPRRQARSEARS